MKTKFSVKVIQKSASENKEYLILDPPYTVFGHTSLPPSSFSIIMKVGGLREMLEGLSNKDSFRIEIFNRKNTEFSFVKDGDLITKRHKK
jgi:hypothetical protein